MACAHAKFTGEAGVCLATSGPGAIHLLNDLYDAKLDHQPVVAIVGQQARLGLDGNYQQEVDLTTLFKDVAHADYDRQVPRALDRSAPNRARAEQSRSEPGDLGAAGHGRRPEVRRVTRATDVPFARWAEMLGLQGIRTDAPRRSARFGSKPCRQTARRSSRCSVTRGAAAATAHNCRAGSLADQGGDAR
jgi:hypothetical protein